MTKITKKYYWADLDSVHSYFWSQAQQLLSKYQSREIYDDKYDKKTRKIPRYIVKTYFLLQKKNNNLSSFLDLKIRFVNVSAKFVTDYLMNYDFTVINDETNEISTITSRHSGRGSPLKYFYKLNTHNIKRCTLYSVDVGIATFIHQIFKNKVNILKHLALSQFPHSFTTSPR